MFNKSVYKPGYISRKEFQSCAKEIAATTDRLCHITSGTTVGMRFNNGALLATETMATRNGAVISTTWNNIYRLRDHIYCAGSGLSSDIQTVLRFSEIRLRPFNCCNSRRRLPIVTVKHVIKQSLMDSRFCSSFLIIGLDKNGLQLSSLHTDGTSENGMFNAIGCRKLPAMAMLENRWNLDINEENAIKLAIDAISAGYVNASPPTYNIDVCIIRTDYSVGRFSKKINTIARHHLRKVRDKKEAELAISSSWLHDLTVLSENVILLDQSMSSIPTQEPPDFQHHLIDSNELRKTAATTQIHGAPPEKKRRLSEMEE